ncbi:MAG: bile acid:sodium symporter family protein [Bacteroidales bacterium]|nr:bile acid:sodium symporter family protein [Bacteroidales bacterium]
MNRFLHYFNKGIVFWVAGFGLLAFLIPESFSWPGKSINIFFALAMFGIGLVIKGEEYKNIAKSPLKIAFGVICQFTIMPSLALFTSTLFGLSEAWTLGLILTGAAPGAMTSNVISYLSKGDVAYSVSLTAVATLLCPVLTPLLTMLLADTKVPVQFFPMFKTIIMVVVLPLVSGFLIRKYFPRFTNTLKEWPSTLSVIAIVMITSYVIAVNKENLGLATLIIICAVAFHNAFGMIAGYFAGFIAKLSHLHRKTLSIEIGMQNAGLGVVLALNHFEKAVAVPAAIFTIWCIFTASLLVYVWSFIEVRNL